MRVISGKFRGRKILSPDGQQIRPTTDRIKSAVFSMLRPTLCGACFIDLFSGSGGIGIEALSEGAEPVYFIEKDKAAIALIKSNLRGISGKYEVIESDAIEALKTLAKRAVQADIIYADPPYKGETEGDITKFAAEVLAPKGVLMVEHSKNTEVPPNKLVLKDQRSYGITVISTFRKPRIAAVTGTFDPFTLGHRFLVEQALEQFDKVYVVHLINPDKVMKYPLEKRMELAKKSLEEFGSAVEVESFSGMAADYCRMRGVNSIVRGFRSSAEKEYEQGMADFNFKACGINTLLLEAVDAKISSTEVRTRVSNGASVEGYVAESVKGEL